MSDFFLMIWLLMIAMTTLVSSFQHHSRISSCCSSHIIKEHSYRYIKNRYNYGQEQNYHIIGDVRFIALSTSALCNTVKEALMNDPDFEVFSRLLKQANLEDVESSIADDSIDTGFNMLTVLAPTNEAFAKLDKDIRAKLIRKDNLPILRKLIRFHFVEDILSKAEVGELPQIDTLALLPVSIKPERSGLLGSGDIIGFKINEARIVKPDISCSNGIIHGVDSLVSPYLLFRYLVGAFPTP